MIRPLALVVAALALSTSSRGQVPAGWQLRVDRSTNSADPDKTTEVKIAKVSGGFRVTTGSAAVIWNPVNTATGTYTLRGTFQLMKPSGHLNYYGLMFGGESLEGASQNYLYFMVGQNGTFIVKHRAGDTMTHEVVTRTAHAAVAKPNDAGTSVNTLEVRVGASKIDYVVNGAVVYSTPKRGMTAKTDGVWGVRINHELDVRVERLGVTK